MRNPERFAIAAVVRGLRRSGLIDNRAVRIIAEELDNAAEEAAQYESEGATAIAQLADDVREMQNE